MPVPVLVNPRLPVPLAKVPLKIVLVPLPPVVKMAVPATLLVTLPFPAKDPKMLEKPPRSSTEFTVKAEPELNPVANPLEASQR